MTIGIIGGGASGLMAAIAAADERTDAQITIIEKNHRVGKKLLATGNGKCNFSNLSMGTEWYYCKDEDKLKRLLSQFSERDMLLFLEANGMLYREKSGYLYPYSEQASSMVLFFERLLKERRIRIIFDEEIDSAYYDAAEAMFHLQGRNASYSFDRLILACGSCASLKDEADPCGYTLVKDFGHTVVPLVPALVQLRCREFFFKKLSGVRAKARVTLLVDGNVTAAEEGELQLTDYGISGIPVFQMSRIAGYALLEGKRVLASIDFFPGYPKERWTELILEAFHRQAESACSDFLIGFCNQKINAVMLSLAGISLEEPLKNISTERFLSLMNHYRNFGVHVTDTQGISHAQVVAGGVPLSEVTDDLESRKQKGLFLAGEMLDIDGKCGGYNLQFAWTSGTIAGRAAVK